MWETTCLDTGEYKQEPIDEFTDCVKCRSLIPISKGKSMAMLFIFYFKYPTANIFRLYNY